MTICIATDNDITANGGITTFNKRLSQTLQAAGHKVIILTVDEEHEDEADAYIETGGQLRVILKGSYKKEKLKYTPYYSPGSYDAPRWIAMGRSFAGWLKSNAKTYGIDLIEISDFGGAGIFLSDSSLPPVIITGHCSLTQYCRYNNTKRDDHFSVINRLENLSFKHASAVITHSRINLDDINSTFNVPVSLAPIPWLADQGISVQSEKDHMLVAGGLQRLKGAEILAESIMQLKNEKPEVRWFGGDSFTSEGGRSMAAHLSESYPEIWNQAFLWKGERPYEEVLNEMAKASIIVIPSIWETFSYVALEAASMGKAIIITDRTGASEIFEHEKNALIIPAYNHLALANAIQELRNDEAKRKRLGMNAIEMIRQRFQADNINERIGIYKNIIEGAGKRSFEKVDLSFLDRYHSNARKIYFGIRAGIKKILRPDENPE